MVKTHEIDLDTPVFKSIAEEQDYIILEDKENKIDKLDYILFKEVGIIEEPATEETEVVDMEPKKEPQIGYTGLYLIAQIKSVINSKYLKENCKLILLNKLQ